MFTVLVKDGQGRHLQCGGIKSAVKQASGILGCKKGDLSFISTATPSGDGFDSYLFDGRRADVDYWLHAISPTTPVLASGKVQV